MIIIAFLLPIVTTTCTFPKRTIVYCDGVIFRDVYYDKEILFSNMEKPYNLILHKFSNLLFFSYTKRNVTAIDTAIRACDTINKACRDITGMKSGYTVAYDPANDDIYMGGDGIYKYNFKTQGIEFFAEKDKSIWELFIRRNFYYIQFPSMRLYVLKDDTFVRVAESHRFEIDHFYMSKHMEIFYSNKTALFKVEKRSRNSYMINDEITVRQITEDTYGDIYFAAEDGIYVENTPYRSIMKVADIHQVYGIAFDEHDHLVVADETSIFRLSPSKFNPACYNAINKENLKEIQNAERDEKRKAFAEENFRRHNSKIPRILQFPLIFRNK